MDTAALARSVDSKALLHSPISRVGSKRRMLGRLLPLLPPHRPYVEPFGGSASVLIAKPPASKEVYSDINPGLAGFFQVVADSSMFREFYRRVRLTPFNGVDWREFRQTWAECGDPVESAYRWYVVARQGYGSRYGECWAGAVRSSSGGAASPAAEWLSARSMLPAIHARLRSATVERARWQNTLERYDGSYVSEGVLFYMDPPTIFSAERGSAGLTLSYRELQEFVDSLLTARAAILLSGPANPQYERLEQAGWLRLNALREGQSISEEGHTQPSRVVLQQQHKEALWASPNIAHFVLHNARHAGWQARSQPS
jgi:DNA adenine methylase